MKRCIATILSLLSFACASRPARAAVDAKFSFSVARAAQPLPSDASLSAAEWAAGRVPDKGAWENVTTRSPASNATQAFFLYDNRNLYVGFRCAQDPSSIVATQTTNDVGFGIDDFVGVGISPAESGEQAYYFYTTPRGVTYQQAAENSRYRPRWTARANVDSSGWTAVMIIPLSVLKLSGNHKQAWHLQFVRSVAGHAEHYAWAYDGTMMDMGGGWPTFSDVRFWPQGTDIDLSGLVHARTTGRADAFGLVSSGQDRSLFQQANGTFLPMKQRNVGLDISYPLTSTINFVGTVNPDFSNVEIDQQTIAPQEFRLQLNEYRPFFAQGASFITGAGNRQQSGPFSQYPNQVFYSPDIGPFDSGAKAEGTFGRQSFGVLTFHGYDLTTNTQFDDQVYGYSHSLADSTFQYWSEGVFGHHGALGNDTTIDMGTQGRNPNTGLVWFADHEFENGTWVPQGHADSTDVFAGIHKPNWEFLTGYLDLSPNFNPIDGFTSNSDIRGTNNFLTFLGSSPGVKQYTLQFIGDRFIDQSGAVHQADTSAYVFATFKNGLSLNGAGTAVGQLRSYDVPAGPGCSGSILYRSAFTGYPCYLNGQTNPYNLYSVPIGYGDGTPTPVDVSYSWGPFGSTYLHLFTTSVSRPVGRIASIGLSYDGTYERSFSTGSLDSQWLRSVSVSLNLGPETSFTAALRDINGYGGFATQIGNNLALSFHERFRTGNEIFINYGSPAAGATLNRLIAKYVFHAGADAGT